MTCVLWHFGNSSWLHSLAPFGCTYTDFITTPQAAHCPLFPLLLRQSHWYNSSSSGKASITVMWFVEQWKSSLAPQLSLSMHDEDLRSVVRQIGLSTYFTVVDQTGFHDSKGSRKPRPADGRVEASPLSEAPIGQGNLSTCSAPRSTNLNNESFWQVEFAGKDDRLDIPSTFVRDIWSSTLKSDNLY